MDNLSTTATPSGARSILTRDGPFLITGTILFLIGAALTIRLCNTMSGGMDMPGGWIMSMAFMKMPGQSWPAAAAMFLTMWTAMMLPMMLPSLIPILISYRRQLADLPRLNTRTTLAAAAYFLIWTLFGTLIYPIGATLAWAEMHSPDLARLVPLVTALTILLAGLFQFTPFKARQLRHCRACPHGKFSASLRDAWTHGLQLGLHCALCCLGLILILLVTNMMDLRLMALITAAITLERLAPRPTLIAATTGLLIIAAGLYQSVRALGWL